MKDVYQLLNEVDVDLEEYDIPELTGFEKKKMKKRMKKKLHKRPIISRSTFVAITAAAFILFSVGIGTQSNAWANMPILGPLLEHYLGTDEDNTFDSYKTVVGHTAKSEQGDITLNEVMIDEGRLLINSSFQPRSDSQQLDELNPFPTVWINGQEVSANGGGDVVQLNDSTFALFSSMDIQGLDLSQAMEIKIVYSDVGRDSLIKGDWTFEFMASGEALLAESKIIPINREFTLANGQRVEVAELIVSPVSSTLRYHIYSTNGLEYEFDVRFGVEDENGKIYEPTAENTLTEDAYFRFEVLTEEVSSLKITPFIISGKEGEEKTNLHHLLEEEAFEVNLR